MVSQALRTHVIQRLPIAACTIVVLYAYFSIKGTYSLLRTCVTNAARAGDLQACQSYPESIDSLVVLLLASTFALVLAATYDWPRKKGNA